MVLWVLSSQSPPDLPPPRIPHLDKLAHALYFGCGGFLLGTGLALGPQKGFPRTRCLASLALLAIIGALDEWHQVFTAGRQGADPYDWLADVCGAATGLTLVRYVEARLREW